MTENLTLLILSYQNLAVQHENMHNYSQSLLFYQIAEDLFEKNRRHFSGENKNVTDEFYKYKLVIKIGNEKSENLDKLGQHFNKT